MTKRQWWHQQNCYPKTVSAVEICFLQATRKCRYEDQRLSSGGLAAVLSLAPTDVHYGLTFETCTSCRNLMTIIILDSNTAGDMKICHNHVTTS